MARKTAGLAHKGLIKGQHHKTTLCQLVAVDAGSLFFDSAIRSTYDQGGILDIFIYILGIVQFSSDSKSVTIGVCNGLALQGVTQFCNVSTHCKLPPENCL